MKNGIVIQITIIDLIIKDGKDIEVIAKRMYIENGIDDLIIIGIMIMRNGIVTTIVIIDPIIKIGEDIKVMVERMHITNGIEELITMNSKQNKNVEYVNRITKYGDVIVMKLEK